MLQDKSIHTPSCFIWWHAPDFRSIVIQLRVITRQWVGFTLKALLILLVHCLYQMKNTRLRLCCSSLNYDLFRKTIPDSSLCTCNQVETAAHFLLYCPLYNRQRQLFIHDLPCPPTINNIIFGDENLSFAQNNRVFLSVQSFIISTNDLILRRWYWRFISLVRPCVWDLSFYSISIFLPLTLFHIIINEHVLLMFTQQCTLTIVIIYNVCFHNLLLYHGAEVV